MWVIFWESWSEQRLGDEFGKALFREIRFHQVPTKIKKTPQTGSLFNFGSPYVPVCEPRDKSGEKSSYSSHLLVIQAISPVPTINNIS